MNLLIWSQYFHPENFVINEMACALQKAGLRVTVVTGLPNYPTGTIYPGYRRFFPYTEVWEGIQIIRLPLIPRRSGRSFWLFLNYTSFILSALLFTPYILKKTKIDTLFVYGLSPILQALPALFVAKFKKCPVVLWVQDLWPESLELTGHIQNPFILKCVKKVVQFIYRRATKILVSSPGMAVKINKMLAEPLDIEVFPNVLPELPVTKKTQLPNNTSILRLMEDSFSFFCATNMGRAQSLDTLLHAAEHLRSFPELKFFVAGTGSLASFYAEKIRQMNLSNLILLGFVNPCHIPALFQKANVLVLTLGTHSALESTIPSKTQSYLRAGRPILCAANGDTAELIEKNGAGIACQAGNSEALAKAALTLYRSPAAELTSYGKKARALFENNFCLETQIPKLIAHLNGNRNVPKSPHV